MGFLKRLFGGKQQPYEDTQGIYLYVACDNCGSRLRVRIDKQYDLNRQSGGFVWRKTLVDSKCFRPMPTTVHFDGNYSVVEAEIEGGRYLTKTEYETPPPADGTDEEIAEESGSADAPSD